jgi:hypothetical protein
VESIGSGTAPCGKISSVFYSGLHIYRLSGNSQDCPDTPLILQKQTLLRFFVSPVGNIGMSGNSLFTVSFIFYRLPD